MKLKSQKVMWMVVSIFMALTGSVLQVIPVYADGPVPTEEQPLEAGNPPLEETVPAQVPEDTQLVVVDENGGVLPLASQAAAQAIVEKDPIWCPSGVAPKPGMGGCSISYGSLSALVAGGPHNANGVIWIEAGTDSGLEVEIDGAGDWASAKNYSLTLQGGWVGGTSGSKAIVGVSVFDTGISIANWNGAVTIKDIALVNASNTLHPSGALYVYTTKNIVLANVTVSGTTTVGADGAFLDNRDSTVQSSVIVKNSSFNDNDDGLSVLSTGAITLTNVTAMNNSSRGVYAGNFYDTAAAAAPASAVTITGGVFQFNTSQGLYIASNGAVKVTNTVGSWNGGGGAYIDNTYDSSTASVTFAGFFTAQSNTNDGIVIVSNGQVALANVIANKNFGTGLSITNTAALTPLGVTLTGNNQFVENLTDGLEILSNGQVTLANVAANENLGKGVLITNTTALTPMAVTFTGNNQFFGNGLEGLDILTKGAVLLNNVTANSNGFGSDNTGVSIDNNFDTTKPQNVTINGTNSFSNNAYHGLYIYTYGAVTLNNITASGNGEDVDNNIGSGVLISDVGAIAKPVILKGTNTFNNNDGSGLHVSALGTVTVSNLTANQNGNIGVYIYNEHGVKSAVTLTGYVNVLSNASYGLGMASIGTITISNITANHNGNFGTFIDNRTGLFQSPVTIAGYGNFISNGSEGLFVLSNGSVTTTNLTASLNLGNGAYIDTIGITAPQTVNIKGNNWFFSNGSAGEQSGLNVNADGKITANNLNATGNYYNGVSLDNFTNWNAPATNFVTFGSIVLTGNNSFSHADVGGGLYVRSHGAVTLSNVHSSFNDDPAGGMGINIVADGNVTLSCIFTNNNKNGIWMNNSVPLLTIKGLYAVDNSSVNEHLLATTINRSSCP
jgi:hypothetical protein